MTQSISPALMQQVQTRCKNLWNQTPSATSATTPDGSVTLQCGYTGGDCGSSGSSWISATERDQGEIFRKDSKKDYYRYKACAIAPDGRHGYVADKDSVVRFRLAGGPLNRIGSTVVEDKPSAMTVTPDGQLILAHEDGQITTVKPPGWLGRLFGTPSPTPLAKVAGDVRGLLGIEGGLIILPGDWEKHVFVLPNGAQTPVRLPLRAYSPENWAEAVKRQAQFLSFTPDEVPLTHAEWLADDEGTCKPHDAGWRDDHKQATVVTFEPDHSVRCWSFDPKTGEAVSLGTLEDEKGRSQARVTYVDDKTATVALGTWSKMDRQHVIDLETGQCQKLPEAALAVARSKSHIVAALPQGLWMWNPQHDSGQMVAPVVAGAGSGKPTLTFTGDGSTIVYTHPTAGMPKLQTLELLKADGTGLQTIPCVEELKLDGNTLHFKLAEEAHDLTLPADLDGISKQPWYQNAASGLLFGKAADPQPVKGVSDDGPTVEIGNVSIPTA